MIGACRFRVTIWLNIYAVFRRLLRFADARIAHAYDALVEAEGR